MLTSSGKLLVKADLGTTRLILGSLRMWAPGSDTKGRPLEAQGFMREPKQWKESRAPQPSGLLCDCDVHSTVSFTPVSATQIPPTPSLTEFAISSRFLSSTIYPSTCHLPTHASTYSSVHHS